jgi:predicted amidohydrolase
VKIEINHGRVIDPKHGVDRVTSLYVAAGTVAAMRRRPNGAPTAPSRRGGWSSARD